MGRACACHPRVFILVGSLAVCGNAFGLGVGETQKADGRTLLATIVDSAGRTQVDFGIDDFVVDDGGEREVIDARIADYPVVVLVDERNRIREVKTAERAATRVS